MRFRSARALIYSIINGKILYILLGVLLGLVVFEGLHILFLLFVLPMFGLECDKITVGFFSFRRVNGRWLKGDDKYAPFVRYTFTGNGSTDPGASHTRFILCRLLAKTVLSVIITVLSLPAWEAILAAPPPDELSFEPDTDWAVFAAFLCIISYFAVMGDVVALIRSAAGEKNTLGGYVQQITRALENGADPAGLDLRPLDEMQFPDEPSTTDTVTYLYYYGTHLLASGQAERLPEPMHKLTDILRSGEFMRNCVNSYAMLIYYYSWLEPDEEYARKFYDKAGTALATDTGAGTKRALAYYCYAVLHDPQKARYYLDRAYKTASAGENRFELVLIGELDDVLKNEGVR